MPPRKQEGEQPQNPQTEEPSAKAEAPKTETKAGDATPTTEVVTQYAVDEPPAGPTLEGRAFEVFRDLAASPRGRTRTPHQLALESFQFAKAFNDVEAQVAAGEVSIAPPEPVKPQLVKIPRIRAKVDSTPVQFEPVLDKNRKPIIDEVLADHGAFCPNAPLDHPANARFIPLDGRTREEHISEARQALLNN